MRFGELVISRPGLRLGSAIFCATLAMGCLGARDVDPPTRVIQPPPTATPEPRPGATPPDAALPDGPAKPECVEGSAVSTELCSAGLACSAGKCVPCLAGESCMPEDPCHKGTRECGAAIKCVDTGMPVEPGTSCGTDKVCTAAGKCEACTTGETCKPADLCKTGKLECKTGAPVCAPSADAPNGSPCGEGQVCSAGACVACRNGMSCVPSNKCHNGSLSCTTGTPQCMDVGTNLPNGTTCGDGQVCREGECTTCVERMPCTPTDNPCKAGEIRCATGTPVCVATAANAPDGKECGAELSCRGGMCRQCRTTGTCSTNPCKDSTYQCMNGLESCRETNKSNGTICGGENACLDGRCARCRNNGECDDNPCRTSSFRCSGGRESCQNLGNVRDGTRACGNNEACRGGSCERCRDSGECTPDDNDDARCKVGRLSCNGNGVEDCVATAQDRPPNFACGGGRVCARAGDGTARRTCRGKLGSGESCETAGRRGNDTECAGIDGQPGYCSVPGASGEGDQCSTCGRQDEDCCPSGSNNGCDAGLSCNSNGACVAPEPPVTPPGP